MFSRLFESSSTGMRLGTTTLSLQLSKAWRAANHCNELAIVYSLTMRFEPYGLRSSRMQRKLTAVLRRKSGQALFGFFYSPASAGKKSRKCDSAKLQITV